MNSILDNWRKLRFTLPIIIGLLLLDACAEINLSKGYNPEYSVTFLNKTGHDLYKVSAYYDNRMWIVPTTLVKGGAATQVLVPLPIPSEAEVRINDNGEHRSIKVSLKDVPRKGFRDGTIYFVINQDGTVDVKPIKLKDFDAAVELEKSIRPKGEYRLGFINKTGRDLKGVSVYYGEQKAGFAGDIEVRVRVNYSAPLTLPIPLEAEVRWKENNVDHAIKAKLEGIVPKGYSEGTIFFVIRNDDTLEIKPIKWGDDKASIKLVTEK